MTLALLLAGCNGDRMKQNANQAPQSWWPFHTHDAL
jgi:hypothetical protein